MIIDRYKKDDSVPFDVEEHNDLRLVRIARDLAGENTTEYNRGMVELIAQSLGLDGMYADRPELVTALILGKN